MPKVVVDGKILHDSPALVIFDKDGTLIDIHHYWAGMIRIRADKAVHYWVESAEKREGVYRTLVDAMGICLETGLMKRSGPVGVKPRNYIVQTVRNALAREGISKELETIEALFKEVDQETAKNISPLLKLLPGVESFLQQCKKNGIRMIVATTDITARADIALKALNIDDYFEGVIGGDKVERNKPAPDPAWKALQQTGIHSKRAIVIGDHPVDIEMGRSGGIDCNVAVLTGLGIEEDFKGTDCWIIPTFEKLEVIP